MDKSSHMLGSYGPNKDSQTAMTPKEQVPSGMLARATYTIKSKFIDDDKEAHLSWEWYVCDFLYMHIGIFYSGRCL